MMTWISSKNYMFKKVYAAMLLAMIGVTQVVMATDHVELMPDEQQIVVCRNIAEIITRYNYKKVALNDSISSVIFNNYIKALDENHSYFLASDIKSFEKYRKMLDDDIRVGNLLNAFAIFNVFQKRYTERIKYSLANLNNKFDFNTHETFVFDRSTLPWPTSQAAMDKLWNQRVKYDLLNLKLANADAAQNKETLKKRYENLLSQADKLSSQDVFQFFMDAFTEAIDPHTKYFNPSNAANFNIEMSRQVEGIGITPVVENEYVTIKSIVPGGPADKSKQLNIDDRIVAIAQGEKGEFQN
ncbi:PDZ domain-containing protein, partial [Ohtaekwangia sp.]|uniref:PDZ domain-containing protein n=1 Tax=Ohtaekwangia sp. TaxID=2066019 RepID=UPI002FDECEBC